MTPMNIGQQIYRKAGINQSVEEEIEKVREIISQIKQNEKPLPDIDLNLSLTTDFIKNIKAYAELADKKFTEIQEKYFKPNGLKFTITVNVIHFYMFSQIYVDSTEISSNDNQTVFEFDSDSIKENRGEEEYDFDDELFETWDSELFDDLLKVLNASYIAIIIGVIWNDGINFQNIEVSYEYD